MSSVLQSFNVAIAITKSDTVNIAGPKTLTDAVYVGGAGIVVAVMSDDSLVAFTAVAEGILPIAIKRINSTTTTATLCIALYQA